MRVLEEKIFILFNLLVLLSMII